MFIFYVLLTLNIIFWVILPTMHVIGEVAQEINDDFEWLAIDRLDTHA